MFCESINGKCWISLIVLAFVVVGSAGAQNLLIDGGFELGLHVGPDEYSDYLAGDNLGAWLCTSNDVMLFGVCNWVSGSWTPPPLEGCELVNLGSGYGPGRIEQAFATTPGELYEVSFWAREYEGTNTTLGEVYVRVYNGSGDDLNVTATYDLTWGQFSYTFTATATTSTLEFENAGWLGTYSPDGVSLDDVRVNLAGSVVGTVDPTSMMVFEDPGLGNNSDTFTVVLDSSPGATDTITVDIDPDSDGDGVDLTVLPTQLAFTSADWDAPQTVTVTAIDDGLVEGEEVDEVGFTITSAECDPFYADARLNSVVSVTIFDDEDGISISKTGVSLNEEGPTSDTYTVVPINAVSGNTTVNIGIPNPADPNVPEPLSEVTVNGASTACLTFTTSDWSIPQTVTVRAIDDSVGDGNPHNEMIGHTVASDDPLYHHISINSVEVTITDNECGSWGYSYYDRDKDCYVSLPDFAEFAAAWLFSCTDPYEPGCGQQYAISHDDLLAARHQIAELEKVKEEIATIESSSINDEWKNIILAQCDAMIMELLDWIENDPLRSLFDKIIEKTMSHIARFRETLTGLQDMTVTGKLLTYSTELFPQTPITPYTAELPGKITTELQLEACAGEFESASLVLWAPEPLSPLVIEATPLQGPGGVIPSSEVDIKYVKCWYQQGCNMGPGYLVPELLLNDDTLVKVDYDKRRNHVKLSFPDGSKYVQAYDTTPVNAGYEIESEEFPIQDADSLQPLDLPAGENKQVWITVKVPPGANAGSYQGQITLSVNGEDIVEPIALTVNVPDFTLADPNTHYDLSQEFYGSLYYWGQLDPTGEGKVGFAMKSEEQFRAELKLLADHGIVAPSMISVSLNYLGDLPFREHLAIMQEFGMSGRPLFSGTSINSLVQQEGFDGLRDNVSQTIAIAHEYGFTEVYFYGIDEATGEELISQRPAWQAVREEGGKVYVSGGPGHFEAVGDLLDLIIFGSDPKGRVEPDSWHNLGHKVFNYAHPQTCDDDPHHYRHNYGLYLWKLDLDGPCTYCFIDTPNSWNDFDFQRGNNNIAYPTINGVIGTLALEGLREAIDDVRYATTLLMEIDTASQKNSQCAQQKAEEALQWLENMDTRKVNLDEVRAEMIQRILELKTL